VIELTGTPAPKDYIDLWAQVFLLDGGKRLGKNITAFRNRYCTQGRERYQWTIRDKAATDEIRRLILDLVYTEKGVDIKTKPPRDVIVPMPGMTAEVYDDMDKRKIVTISGQDIVALSPGTKVQKLSQISSGAIYDGDTETHWLNKRKFSQVDDLFDDIDDNVLVVYNFVFDREEFLRRYPDTRPLNDKRDIADWNKGRISKLLMHPKSGGHGLNLWQGGNTIMWLSPTWDNELYAQVNMRLSHPDKEATTVIQLLSDSRTDTNIELAREHKELNQQGLMKFILTNQPKRP